MKSLPTGLSLTLPSARDFVDLDIINCWIILIGLNYDDDGKSVPCACWE